MNMTSELGSKSKVPLRAWLHLGMGVVYLLFAILVVYVKYFGSIELSEASAYGMGALLGLYGIFRIYRGITDIRQARG
jgi:hypothetical protein